MAEYRVIAITEPTSVKSVREVAEHPRHGQQECRGRLIAIAAAALEVRGQVPRAARRKKMTARRMMAALAVQFFLALFPNF